MYPDPSEWGPDFWRTLHRISASYEENPSPTTMKTMSDFILSIPTLLPCKECSEHAFIYISQNIDYLPKITSSRDELFDFFFKFHNEVNKRLHKKEITKEKALKMYGIVEDKTDKRIIYVSSILIIIIISIIYLYYQQKRKY